MGTLYPKVPEYDRCHVNTGARCQCPVDEATGRVCGLPRSRKKWHGGEHYCNDPFNVVKHVTMKELPIVEEMVDVSWLTGDDSAAIAAAVLGLNQPGQSSG